MGALGRASDSPLVVLDESIGGISLGMTRAQVEGLYGAPDSTLVITLRGGGAGILARYTVHGGLLLVDYADDRVVSIETTAPFFKTEGGVGPGTSKGGIHGLREDFCGGGLWTGAAGMPPEAHVTAFQTSGDEVFGITVTELGYYDSCQGASDEQEVDDPRPGTLRLTVQVDPDGAGWVRSSPYGIDCPSDCSAPFARDATIALTATPTNGFTFEGWSGACSGAGPCSVTLDEAASVTARFSGSFVPAPVTTTRPKTTSGSQ